ncbi:hypothetical protein BABINDRAFT_160102 [Babjeviella inositovora NRRL Y-12698]|uniref:Uncharacterized protein n=1 Tax=Babjeviella inositovora NRRL Y-12698 TaxID=984486 RepID=A0A1E3QXT4_9ASCO|nr:uncharacterized protein BABINDRAFT_160102 [Babjeviella inositovora NRRL Y-12698]ODQ81872.1 hypothetical protein BABINDRAFT_160102 [Babjeviella inositovora NRRL Y-12698]
MGNKRKLISLKAGDSAGIPLFKDPKIVTKIPIRQKSRKAIPIVTPKVRGQLKNFPGRNQTPAFVRAGTPRATRTSKRIPSDNQFSLEKKLVAQTATGDTPNDKFHGKISLLPIFPPKTPALTSNEAIAQATSTKLGNTPRITRKNRYQIDLKYNPDLSPTERLMKDRSLHDTDISFGVVLDTSMAKILLDDPNLSCSTQIKDKENVDPGEPKYIFYQEITPSPSVDNSKRISNTLSVSSANFDDLLRQFEHDPAYFATMSPSDLEKWSTAGYLLLGDYSELKKQAAAARSRLIHGQAVIQGVLQHHAENQGGSGRETDPKARKLSRFGSAMLNILG